MQRFSNFLEGGSLLREKGSTNHLTLVPFESKFVNFVAYFNTIIFTCNLTCSIIGVGRTVRDHFNVQTGCRQNY